MPLFSKMMTPRLHHRLYRLLVGPQLLAFLPAAVLAGFWLGGELLLILMALGLPLGLALGHQFRAGDWDPPPRSGRCGGEAAEEFAADLGALLAYARRKSRKTACFLVEIDEFPDFVDRFGPGAAETVTARIAERLQAAMRKGDRVVRLQDARFGIALAPVSRLPLDTALLIADRFQAAAEAPSKLDAAQVYVTASVGLCLETHVATGSGKALADAAERALAEALRHGPSAVRVYAPDMRTHEPLPQNVSDEVTRALEAGQIEPWFQPQVCTDTGRVTGFEALARWRHPERGMIPPSEFLPVMEQAARMEQLGDIMLDGALRALIAWDAQGFGIPQVGVNFSPQELRNPRLVDKIRWALDLHDLAPPRLMVEILETVVATSPDDTVSHNIRRLADLGCHIDLDDFGTGHASISSIRRFDIQRLKIDRSFVRNVDQDPEQQRMVSAILMMAEQLRLGTLAEGVETAGEHAMLAQLGCRHVQGYGISRPMPFDRTARWIADHAAKLETPPLIGRRVG